MHTYIYIYIEFLNLAAIELRVLNGSMLIQSNTLPNIILVIIFPYLLIHIHMKI